MFAFFDTFTHSFLVSIALWPFASALLTFPLLLVHYIRFRYISLPHALLTYGGVLYLLALAAFTLYPFPENATQFCHTYTLSPNLTPFASVASISTEGQRAILQILANIIFFVPLGVFLRTLFRYNPGTIALIALAVSLTIETAQLTGAFGQYPCSYRLFDIDDLVWNVLGGVVGMLIASLLPPLHHDTSRKMVITTQPGLVRRITGFSVDIIVVEVLSLLAYVPLLLAHIITSDNDGTRAIIFWLMLAATQIILPFFTHGRTIGGYIVGMSLDSQPRGRTGRLAAYLTRMLYIVCLLINPLARTFAVILTCITWIKWRILPYHLIDTLQRPARHK